MPTWLLIFLLGIALMVASLIFIRQKRYLYYKKLSYLLHRAYEEENINLCVRPPKMLNSRWDGLNFLFCKRFRRYVEQQFFYFQPKKNK
jgi:hypothetical protein